MLDGRNLYFITASYGEKYFLLKGKLACNYNAAPNILLKIYNILFLTYMSLWSLTWHHSVTCVLCGCFPICLFMAELLNWKKALRLFKLTCSFFPHQLWKVCHLNRERERERESSVSQAENKCFFQSNTYWKQLLWLKISNMKNKTMPSCFMSVLSV